MGVGDERLKVNPNLWVGKFLWEGGGGGGLRRGCTSLLVLHPDRITRARTWLGKFSTKKILTNIDIVFNIFHLNFSEKVF